MKIARHMAGGPHPQDRPKEMVEMVRKETCSECKGNRWITVRDLTGRDIHKKCPSCGGQGFKVRIVR